MSFHSLTLSATDCLWFLSLSSRPCTAHLDPLLQCHSWCTASWEGACFAPSWETSCWWSPRPLTTGCSTVCRAASPTRDCGGTACPASATCKPTASVGAMRLYMRSSLKRWGGGGRGGLEILYLCIDHSAPIYLPSYLQSPCFFYRWTSKLYKGFDAMKSFKVCNVWNTIMTLYLDII